MKKLKSFFSGMYLTLIFIFLYAPIVTLIIFSFNEGKGSRWKGFSLKWYEDLFESRMIMEALSNICVRNSCHTGRHNYMYRYQCIKRKV